MQRLDTLRRNLKTAMSRIEINKKIVAKTTTPMAKYRAKKKLKKYYNKAHNLVAKIKRATEKRKKPEINKQEVLKVQKIIAEFYKVCFDKSNPIEPSIGKAGKARIVLSYMLAVYFKGVSHKQRAEAVGRKQASISYGYIACLRLSDNDIYFRKELKDISKMVAVALSQEIKDTEISTIEKVEAITERAKIRTSKEMPTVLNPWLKSLSEKKLKGEVIKPVYF